MMQMLAAGGMIALSDGQRCPDANNPRGYYELEAIKSLARDARIISQAEGKSLKVISSLLQYLPAGHEYRVIFMRRPLMEIVASQDRMLERLGQKTTPAPRESVFSAFEKHLRNIENWLETRPQMTVLYVEYGSVLRDPHAESARISAFLGQSLDLEAMVGKVERSLHRERIGSASLAGQ
jgi:hypothetical protein